MAASPEDRSGTTRLIACGALAREVKALIDANGLDHLELTCLPAKLHNRPERIAEAEREALDEDNDDDDDNEDDSQAA